MMPPALLCLPLITPEDHNHNVQKLKRQTGDLACLLSFNGSSYRLGAGPGKTGRLSWPSRPTAATAKK
jgi:hypothetical protein